MHQQSSVTECWIFLYSGWGQRRRRWYWKWSPFKLATGRTLVNDGSDQTSSLYNRKSLNLCQSFIHHCAAHVCEHRLTIRGVREWFRGCRWGYFVEYRISALASLPPQCHPSSSKNRYLSESKEFSCFRSPCESSIHLCLALASFWERMDNYSLLLSAALTTYAVTFTNLL